MRRAIDRWFCLDGALEGGSGVGGKGLPPADQILCLSKAADSPATTSASELAAVKAMRKAALEAVALHHGVRLPDLVLVGRAAYRRRAAAR